MFPVFFKDSGHQRTAPQKDTEMKEELDRNPILCAGCQYEITSINQGIAVQGQHIHIFSNPGGFVFEIGCFAVAPGCVNQGKPTLEFSWFNGFNWNFALCLNCHLHLGWHFRSDLKSFYGLILNHLIQGQ